MGLQTTRGMSEKMKKISKKWSLLISGSSHEKKSQTQAPTASISTFFHHIFSYAVTAILTHFNY